MNIQRLFRRVVWLAVCAMAGSVVCPLAVAAQERPAPSTTAAAAAAAADMTPEARAALIDALADKWSAYVQVTHGVDVDIWRHRLRAWASAIDGTNLRNALKRDTYDLAMATLVGRGGRAAARASAADSDATGAVDTVVNRLGDLSADLAYTPVTPCRIVDTRVTGGAIAAASSRSFWSVGASTYAGQGGSATNCGLFNVAAAAVAINVTAVTPAAAGYATLFSYATAQPLTASVNYAAGDVVNNTVITKIPNPLAQWDFTLFSSAQSHYVVDIVGYFAPNETTPLECVETTQNETALATNATLSAIAPACPAGYSVTATNCQAANASVNIFVHRNGVCTAFNPGGASAIRASYTCCRIPGR